MKTGVSLALSLTLAITGLAQAQSSGGGQVCLHRTADGRCVHWSGARSTPSQEQYRPAPQASSVPTSGCVSNPATGRSETCLHIAADGRCLHYGGSCN